MLQITGYELLADNSLRLQFDKGFGITQYLVLDLGLNFEPGAAEEISAALAAGADLSLEPLLIEGGLSGDLRYTDADGNIVSLSDRLISQALASPRPEFTGHWQDISDRPSIPVVGTDFVAPSSLSPVAFSGSWNNLVDRPNLALVALTGSWNSLVDRPIIPTIPTMWAWDDISGKPSFFSGSWNDLIDKPTIPTIPATWDWADITGKPSFFSGSYLDLSDKPIIPTIPATWDWTDISGKPTFFSGSYLDLSDRPSIPVAGVDYVPLSGGTFTGYVYATSRFIAGNASGSVAMTINDGGGNANLTFNHAGQVPDQDGNSARISVNTDDSTNPEMLFALNEGVTGGVSTSRNSRLILRQTALYPASDNGLDLGLGNRHFKDLHLSGSIFLGGQTLTEAGLEGLLSLPSTFFSGSYLDLTDKPTIPTVPPTWAWTDISGKPSFFSGSYLDLSDRPSIPVAGVDYVARSGGSFTGDITSSRKISSTTTIAAGQGSGSVALTVNDSGGNANITFNHDGQIPDVSGSSGRISVGVDSTNALMEFSLNNNVTQGVQTSRAVRLTLTPSALYPGADGGLTLGLGSRQFSDLFLRDSVRIGAQTLTESGLQGLLSLPSTFFSGSWDDITDKPSTFPTDWDSIENNPNSRAIAPSGETASIVADASNPGLFEDSIFSIADGLVFPQLSLTLEEQLLERDPWTWLLVLEPGSAVPKNFTLSFNNSATPTFKISLSGSLLFEIPPFYVDLLGSFRHWPLLIIGISYDYASRELRVNCNRQSLVVPDVNLANDGDIVFDSFGSISASIVECLNWSSALSEGELTELVDSAFNRHSKASSVLDGVGTFDFIECAYPTHNKKTRLNHWTDNYFYIKQYNLDDSGGVNLAALSPANSNFYSSSTQFHGDIIASNPLIVASDESLKSNIRGFSDAEIRVALNISPAIFQWNEAIASKGDEARLHCGAIAQDVEAAFVAEGLDPDRYGINCRDTYWVYDDPELGSVRVNSFDSIPLEHQSVAVQTETKSLRLSELYAFAFASVLSELRSLKNRVAALDGGPGAFE